MQTPWTAAIEGIGMLRLREEYSRGRRASIEIVEHGERVVVGGLKPVQCAVAIRPSAW